MCNIAELGRSRSNRTGVGYKYLEGCWGLAPFGREGVADHLETRHFPHVLPRRIGCLGVIRRKNLAACDPSLRSLARLSATYDFPIAIRNITMGGPRQNIVSVYS